MFIKIIFFLCAPDVILGILYKIRNLETYNRSQNYILIHNEKENLQSETNQQIEMASRKMHKVLLISRNLKHATV